VGVPSREPHRSLGTPCRLEKDTAQARADIRGLLDRLAEKHGATPRDVSVAMRSINDTLGDLLYDQARALQHEVEDLTPA
jgi:hypothetical protein